MFQFSEGDCKLCCSQTQMEKTCFVLAYLTSKGRVPLLGLNDIIAGVLRGWPSRRVGWILLQTFYQCRLATGANTSQRRRRRYFFLKMINEPPLSGPLMWMCCVSSRCVQTDGVAPGADGPHPQCCLWSNICNMWRRQTGVLLSRVCVCVFVT